MSSEKAELTSIIEQIYNDSKQIYGASKIHAIMNDRGYHVSYSTVASIMHENDWFSIRTSAKTLYLQNKEREKIFLIKISIPKSPMKFGLVMLHTLNSTIKHFISVLSLTYLLVK